MERKKIMTPRLFSVPKSSQRQSTFPFTQKPSENQFPGSGKPADLKETPSELFSRFTADVIKKDVVFER
jgi:hypothetical protein